MFETIMIGSHAFFIFIGILIGIVFGVIRNYMKKMISYQTVMSSNLYEMQVTLEDNKKTLERILQEVSVHHEPIKRSVAAEVIFTKRKPGRPPKNPRSIEKKTP